MISQQFLDYIKRTLDAGIDRETIKKTLVINGLSEQEIAEGFAAAGNSQTTTNEVPISVDPVGQVLPPVISSAPTPASAQPQGIAMPAQVINKIWSKVIPKTNIWFMVTSLLLVFGLDLGILIFPELVGLKGVEGLGEFDLLILWAAMLAVLGIFGIFFYLENRSFKKRFMNSYSKLDSWICAIIVIRNLIFVLNFIPFVQIAGGVALAFGGIPFLVVYCALLFKRRALV